MSVNIQIRNEDGTYYSLIRKDHIKFLGVMIDDSISWKLTEPETEPCHDYYATHPSDPCHVSHPSRSSHTSHPWSSQAFRVDPSHP